MNTEMPLLKVENLSVPLPEGLERQYAVSDINIHLEPREILCVVGESGSGKSMLANAIMGLLPYYIKPSGGRILFRGDDLLRMSEGEIRNERGRSLAMVFQEPLSALNPLMTIGEQISEVMRVHGEGTAASRKSRVLELLDYVGLPQPEILQYAYPFRLSGGQRQRVMIAMALVLEPAILIADEPTTALDVTTQAQILELICRIQREKGMAVLFITHDFGVVADIADRVVVMEQGRIVEQGNAEDVLERPSHPYTRQLISSIPYRRSNRPALDGKETPLLTVHGLCKTYSSSGGWFAPDRTTVAVDDVSFAIRRGETLGLVGESGSGKSTIGRCVLRLAEADGGEVIFDGTDILPILEDAFRPYRSRMQMIFQDPFSSLNPRHSIGRILMEGPMVNGMSRERAGMKARELLNMVGLDPSSFSRYPHEFSGGQRQRVGIARALSLDPEFLVADEAVSALDVSVQAQVLVLLQRLQRQLGLAILFITHDLRVAAQICDRVAVMHQGKLVEQGPTAKLFEHPAHEYTKGLIAAIPGSGWEPPVLAVS